MILASSCRKATWPYHYQKLEPVFRLCLSALLQPRSSLVNAMLPREASIAIVLKRVVKSFLLGRTFDPIFSNDRCNYHCHCVCYVECFLLSYPFDCEPSMLTSLISVSTLQGLASWSYYGSNCPRIILSIYLMRWTHLPPGIPCPHM